MLLTDQERARFVAYLESDASDSEGMAEQMGKFGGPPQQALAKKLRMEAAACKIVAAKLKATESMEVR